MVSVYLCECDVWSDGADDHEEDHNYYYDIKYFILDTDTNYICIFAWNAYNSHEYNGIITLWDNPKHIMELQCSKKVDEFTKEKCKKLVEYEMNTLQRKIDSEIGLEENRNRYKKYVTCAQKFLDQLN